MRRPLDLVFKLFPRLSERLDQRAETLSGGEQQMLAIGRALMTRPRLLMLDEPSQGIMPKLVDEIFQAVKRIRDTGVTVLIVEQRIAECLDIADRAYILQTGRLQMQGTSDEIKSNPDVRKAYLGLVILDPEEPRSGVSRDGPGRALFRTRPSRRRAARGSSGRGWSVRRVVRQTHPEHVSQIRNLRRREVTRIQDRATADRVSRSLPVPRPQIPRLPACRRKPQGRDWQAAPRNIFPRGP